MAHAGHIFFGGNFGTIFFVGFVSVTTLTLVNCEITRFSMRGGSILRKSWACQVFGLLALLEAMVFLCDITIIRNIIVLIFILVYDDIALPDLIGNERAKRLLLRKFALIHQHLLLFSSRGHSFELADSLILLFLFIIDRVQFHCKSTDRLSDLSFLLIIGILRERRMFPMFYGGILHNRPSNITMSGNIAQLRKALY